MRCSSSSTGQRTREPFVIAASGSNRSRVRSSRCGGFTPGTLRRSPRRSSGCGSSRERGPSPDVFTFRKPFPSPTGDDVASLDAAFCDFAS
jgi:hypothetical protein